MSNLVKTTIIFYANVEDFPMVNEVYARHMPSAASGPFGAGERRLAPRALRSSIDAVPDHAQGLVDAAWSTRAVHRSGSNAVRHDPMSLRCDRRTARA